MINQFIRIMYSTVNTNDMLYILDDDLDIYNYAADNSLVCFG